MDSEESYYKFIAYTFIQGTDHRRKFKIKEDLYNQFSLCVNSYPCDLANATNMIIDYKKYLNDPKHPGKKNQQSKKDSYK